MTEPRSPWEQALLAAQVAAAAGAGLGGLHLRARAGPVREAFLEVLRGLVPEGSPWRRLTPSVPEARLLGGLDVAATLAQGRAVAEPGLLARADGGFAMLAMAERAGPDFAGILANVMDTGAVTIEREGLSRRVPARFALIALDEGAEPEEGLPRVLADRLALRVDLSLVSIRDIAAVPVVELVPAVDLHRIGLSDDLLRAMVEAAAAAGWISIRAPLWLSRVARVLAALDGAVEVEPDHARDAFDLVFGPMAAPEEASPAEPPPPPPPDEAEAPDDPADAPDDAALDAASEILVAAQMARRPCFDLAAGLRVDRGARSGAAGKSGDLANRRRRGRPVGITDRAPFPDARPDLLATLRAAAPWQKLRVGPSNARAKVRPGDFRYIRRRQNMESTAIFAVDASGSTALERLGEAKGAVELLLAECYVRRDSVALVAFRGTEADLMLEPTRSLVRAKRSLAGLPGGGPTPLADGLVKALAVARSVRAHGRTGLLVVLTDGSGNVALGGALDRAAASEDAETVARHIAASGIKSVVIDISRRPRPAAQTLAETMQAEYCALPAADAASLSRTVASYMKEAG